MSSVFRHTAIRESLACPVLWTMPTNYLIAFGVSCDGTHECDCDGFHILDPGLHLECVGEALYSIGYLKFASSKDIRIDSVAALERRA
jgi:hypothetical protein